MVLNQGEIIADRYEICEKLGSGGMAIVYRALDKKLNRYVTFKVMREEYVSDDEFIKRFNIEARAVAGIPHQNLVSVYDVGHDGMVYYIVMEYVNGSTLKEFIERKAPFDNEKTLGVAIQIGMALEHAHKNGIIHRDIKPQNILITPEGVVKVTDFGISRAVTEATISATGNTIGSVHYLSPEQARGGYVDFKSDIYSLGIVMYEMATGELPFDGETPVSVALKHINEELPDIREKVPNVSISIEKIIRKATEKSTSKRYQTIEEIDNDLKRAFTNETGDFVNQNPEAPVSSTISFSEAEMSMIRKEATAAFFDGEDISIDDDDDGNDEIDKSTEKKTIIAAVVTGLSLVVLLSSILLHFYNKSKPVPVDVPMLIGYDIDEAKERGKAIGITITDVERRYDDVIQEGIIIDQDFKAGDVIYEGGNISVVVSRGTDKIPVPDFTKQTEDDVSEKFENLPFNADVKYEYDDNTPMYVVIRQEPKEGELVDEGSTITLYVSLGAEVKQVLVPKVEGLTEEQARLELVAARLTIGNVSSAESSRVAKDKVITQTIAAGKRVSAGSVVNLVISSGPPKVTETPPPSSNTITRSLTLKPTYVPEGMTSIMYKVLKYTSTGTAEVVKEEEVAVSDFPLTIEVSGVGEAEIQFYVYFDNRYNLQGRQNINFDEGDD